MTFKRLACTVLGGSVLVLGGLVVSAGSASAAPRLTQTQCVDGAAQALSALRTASSDIAASNATDAITALSSARATLSAIAAGACLNSAIPGCAAIASGAQTNALSATVLLSGGAPDYANAFVATQSAGGYTVVLSSDGCLAP